MSCTDSYTLGPSPVWSQGSSTLYVFHPFTAPLSTIDIKRARVSIEMGQNSGNAEIRPACRTSNDGVTWSTVDPLLGTGQGALTADGTSYGTEFIDLTGLANADVDSEQLIQFGVQCKNSSGSTHNMCNATLKVETR